MNHEVRSMRVVERKVEGEKFPPKADPPRAEKVMEGFFESHREERNATKRSLKRLLRWSSQ